MTQLGFRLLPADDWEDSDQLLADAGLLLVLHRLQAQHSETGRTRRVLRGEAVRLSVPYPRAGPQHSVSDLSPDRLEVKTMEVKTPR